MRLLKCSELTKRFGGVVALNGLDIEIYESQIVGLIGPNGSGKTTFFNVLTGITPLTSGSINYCEQRITNRSAQRIYRSGITRTFQRCRLCLSLSVFDNILLGNHKLQDSSFWTNIVHRDRLRRQLKETRAEVFQLLETFSADLTSRWMDPVGALPMIDRRRIEICRALISHPRLLLLDEPSAGMTPLETHELMDNILEVKRRDKGLTIILIEHQMDIIERITNRCVVMNWGSKICEGSFLEVANNEQVIEAYLGRKRVGARLSARQVGSL